MTPVTEEDLARTFLQLGYLPDPSAGRLLMERMDLTSLPLRTDPVDGVSDSEVSDWEDVETSLRHAVSTACGTGSHVVPITGGLDSRILLLVLLSELGGAEIQTATFGVPGSWDYEIGPQVAAALDLPHTRLGLDDVVLDADDLEALARNGASWTPLIRARFNRVIPRWFGTDFRYWSGFLGDALSGSHLPDRITYTWGDAVDGFLRRNTVRGPVAHEWSDAVRTVLPPRPILDRRCLSYEDQLHIIVQQASFIRPAIVATGYDFEVPFESARVAAAFLALPVGERFGRAGYWELLRRLDPEVAAVPTTARGGLSEESSRVSRRLRGLYREAVRRAWGRWPRLTRPRRAGLRYIDFDHAFRERPDYRDLAGDCVHALRRRGVLEDLDLDGIWRDHRNGSLRAGAFLELVCSLEISLRAGDGWPEGREPW